MACYIYWPIHFNLPTRAFNLATCAFSVLTRESELVTRRFELVTRVLLFHPQAVVQGLLENRLTFFDEIKTLSVVVPKYFFEKNNYRALQAY